MLPKERRKRWNGFRCGQPRVSQASRKRFSGVEPIAPLILVLGPCFEEESLGRAMGYKASYVRLDMGIVLFSWSLISK